MCINVYYCQGHALGYSRKETLSFCSGHSSKCLKTNFTFSSVVICVYQVLLCFYYMFMLCKHTENDLSMWAPANVWFHWREKKKQWTTSIYCDGIVWARLCVCVYLCFIFIMVYYIKSTSFMEEEATKPLKIHVKKYYFCRQKCPNEKWGSLLFND